MNSWFFVCSFLILGQLAFGEEIKFTPCADEDNIKCTIHSVKIDPCKEAAKNAPCKIKRGKSASISFDFTPDFSGDSVECKAYWTGGIIDLPFAGMESYACPNIGGCPLVAGKKSTYSYNLPISKTFPTRVYEVKWKLWNEQNEQCCFISEIQLMR